MTTLLWMRSDIRLVDSRAVALALQTCSPADLIVVRTSDGPAGCVPPTARRTAHERRRFDELRPILERAGIRAIDATPSCDGRDGPSRDIVALARELDAKQVVSNIEVGDGLGYAYDRRVASTLRGAGIEFTETGDGGIARGSKPAPDPFVTGSKELPPLRFTAVPEPIAALRTYLDRLPYAHYRRDMWLPGPDARASSRLSIDLACGALASDRAVHETIEVMEDADPRHKDAYRQFLARLGWRHQFVQMLESGVAAFPWGYTRQERVEDAPRMTAWLAGETGYPLVDAAMRDLKANGWINFRLRQVVCSFAIDLLALDMHEVGVALGSLFDDYCPGIHWPQIGLQYGMAKGRGPRVVNPVKQAKELDPSGTYVRSILPHLRDIPDADIHEPWKATFRGMPTPIVDYAIAARAARERHPT